MFLRLRMYHRPRDLAEALVLLSEAHTRGLAGGTALVGPLDDETEALIDLRGLELNYLRWDGAAVSVGAMTALAELADHPVLQGIASGILRQAILRSGPPPMLHRATIGGAVARPAQVGEVMTVLLALDARVLTLRLGQEHSVIREGWDIRVFLQRRSEILHTALVEGIRIPTHQVAAALERVARTDGDAAIVAVAAALQFEGDRCHKVRIAATGLADQPERLEAAEAELQDVVLTDAQIARVVQEVAGKIDPPSDLRGGADYRRHLANVLVRRALAHARAVAMGSEKE